MKKLSREDRERLEKVSGYYSHPERAYLILVAAFQAGNEVVVNGDDKVRKGFIGEEKRLNSVRKQHGCRKPSLGALQSRLETPPSKRR